MTKEQVIEKIVSVCRNLKFDIYMKCKTERWSADVVVNYGTYKVAFNVCKCPNNVELIYNAMKKERVCGCWLLLPARKSVYIPSDLPCFKLDEMSDSIYAILNSWPDRDDSNAVKLDTFVPSLIKGQIRLAQNMTVKYMEICFFEKQCWNCAKKSHVYFINRLFSADGISIPGIYVQTDDLALNPFIVKAVTQYIKEHSELKITMGEIKPRFSKTEERTYTSFGCAFCDSLFGEFYVGNETLYMRNHVKELPKAIIEIQGDISIPINCWYKMKMT